MTPLFDPDPLPATIQGNLAVEPEEARSILRPQRDEAYGFGFSLSPYRGCAHACQYCYLREYPHPHHPAQDWGTWVAPKLNAPERLWAERHRLHQQSVFLSTATDPYQPLERTYRLTRACLEVLLRCPTTRVLVHTRSPLVLQDLELLRAFGDRLSVGLSIPTDDDTLRQIVEPKAPAIPSRWSTVERLAKAGIAVQVSATPLLPMLDPKAFGQRARHAGAQQVWVGRLRLLKDDPMQDLLARHGWLRALDEAYAAEVRAWIGASFPSEPRPKRSSKRPPSIPPVPPPLEAPHPALFDAASLAG